MASVILAGNFVKFPRLKNTFKLLEQQEEVIRCISEEDINEITSKKDFCFLDSFILTDDANNLIKKIKQKAKTIIVICKDSKESLDTTLNFIELGADSYVIASNDKTELSIEKELFSKFYATVSIDKIKKNSFQSTRKKIIVIGSSTGGPQTVESLLVSLPKNIPAPILIVQHMPPAFTESFAERLNGICEIEVKEAEDGDELRNGVAYIAKGGYHMELVSKISGFEGTIELNEKPKEQSVRPSVDVLFRSVAKIFKENTIGIVLTGMGKDGTNGSQEIKKYEGTIIAQSEQTSIIYGMPKSVVDEGLADMILDLDKIPMALIQLLEV